MNEIDLRSLSIKSEGLDEAITKLEAICSQLAELITEANSEAQSLQGEWEANGANGFFTSVSDSMKEFQNLKQALNADLDYLKKVSANYQSTEASINSLVDSNITVKG